MNWKYLKMTKSISTVEFYNCKKLFDQFGQLISRRKVELKNILNLVNCNYQNISIIQTELLKMNMLCEIVAICLFLVADFECWNYWILIIWKIGKFSTKDENNKNVLLISISIWNFKRLCNLKFICYSIIWIVQIFDLNW